MQRGVDENPVRRCCLLVKRLDFGVGVMAGADSDSGEAGIIEHRRDLGQHQRFLGGEPFPIRLTGEDDEIGAGFQHGASGEGLGESNQVFPANRPRDGEHHRPAWLREAGVKPGAHRRAVIGQAAWRAGLKTMQPTLNARDGVGGDLALDLVTRRHDNRVGGCKSCTLRVDARVQIDGDRVLLESQRMRRVDEGNIVAPASRDRHVDRVGEMGVDDIGADAWRGQVAQHRVGESLEIAGESFLLEVGSVASG